MKTGGAALFYFAVTLQGVALLLAILFHFASGFVAASPAYEDPFYNATATPNARAYASIAAGYEFGASGVLAALALAIAVAALVRMSMFVWDGARTCATWNMALLVVAVMAAGLSLVGAVTVSVAGTRGGGYMPDAQIATDWYMFIAILGVVVTLAAALVSSLVFCCSSASKDACASVASPTRGTMLRGRKELESDSEGDEAGGGGGRE